MGSCTKTNSQFYKQLYLFNLSLGLSSHQQTMQLIKRRIKEIGQPIDKITEMDLSGNQLKTFTPEMKKLLEQCKNLQTLILCECDLVSLQNLPKLPQLTFLDISTNSLSDQEISKLAIYDKLTELSIADNKIQKLQTIKQLSSLKKLQSLECGDNDIEKLPDYFKTVFNLFPALKSLDNKNKEGVEMDAIDDEDQELYNDEGQGQEAEDSDEEEFEGEKWEKEDNDGSDGAEDNDDDNFEVDDQEDDDD